MKRTSVYFISVLLLFCLKMEFCFAQDTLDIPLKIRVGAEVSGPVIWYTGKKILNAEGYVSVDLNERRSVILGGGYLNYSYSQYNYDYMNKGFFARAGIDFNLLAPQKAKGVYWAGIGLHYGISHSTYETPFFMKENYWGTVESSIPTRKDWAHFVEFSPGVRAEIFRNVSLGWTVNMRLLVHTGASKSLRPIYLPGFGNSAKNVSSGISYFLIWNIPFKRITVITKPEEPEETDLEQQPAAKPQNQY